MQPLGRPRDWGRKCRLMKLKSSLRTALIAVCFLTLGSIHSLAELIVDFEDLLLAPESFHNGSDLSGDFFSQGVQFGNSYHAGFEVWSGFSYSNVDDPTTPGPENQYAAAAGGGGGNYVIGFDDAFSSEQKDVITLSNPSWISGFFVTTTTYAALSMRDGDAFAKRFGGIDGADPDWFLLTITGHDRGGQEIDAVEFYLADFRSDDPAQDYIVIDWTWVDTSSLGADVSSLQFSLASSDNGPFGMNTPAYFAMDHVVVVPEPSSAGLIAIGVIACGFRFRRIRP